MPYKDPAKQAAYFAAHYRKNIEKKRAYNTQYLAEHPQDLAAKSERSKTHYRAHAEYYAERNKRWYAKKLRENPDYNKGRHIAYPEAYKAASINRDKRLRKAGLAGRVGTADWKAVLAKYGHQCLCCHRTPPEISLSVDHIIPITLGGTHDISNIQPLCRSCNSRKHKQIVDYRPDYPPACV